MRRAVFLDRDGVINRKARSGEYIRGWDEFRFIERAKDAVKLLNRAGYAVIVVTNQRGVARGLMTEGDLKQIHEKMRMEIEASGGKIDAIFSCTHDHEDKCLCRKPGIGMLLKAKKKFGIDLGSSYMIGDSITDIEAGTRAGLKENILIADGTDEDFPPGLMPHRIFKDVYTAAYYLFNASL